VLSPFDDYPVHQTSQPIAHAGGGHPDHYDRFWFNGYTEEAYFAVALGLYPNRGIIDAAFSVVHDGAQRSVFASGRIPLDRTRTRIGPISVEIVEPLRVNRIRVDAPDHGLVADLVARARTPACEEAPALQHDGTRLVTDYARATQMVEWNGELSSGGRPVELTGPVYGTKDRSWGVRPVGDPTPAAPRTRLPQLFFLWAPLNFDDQCLHYMTMEDSTGEPWAQTAALLPVIGADGPVFGADTGIRHLPRTHHEVQWAPGLRRSNGAVLTLPAGDGSTESVELEPVLTFRMKGAGYFHPEWGHGRWHDELAVGGEAHRVEELDTLAFDCIHVQQVMRAKWGGRTGLGVLEQLVIGPYEPGGFREVLDGAPGP
jgi:hypothetical protein